MRLAIWLAAISVATALGHSYARAEAFVFHAAQSGQQTLDTGEGGGNPFASALVEILSRPSMALSKLPAALQDLTSKKSRGFQSADVPAARKRPLTTAAAGSRRSGAPV